MSREAFTFFESYRTATAKLDDATRLAVYDAVMDYALFDTEPEFDNVVAEAIFSLVRPNVDASNKKRESGSKGGASCKQTASNEEANRKQTVSNEEANRKQTASDKDKDKDKDKESNNTPLIPPQGGKRFQKPTVDEVRAYCVERGNSVDPRSFVDFYASKGWLVGNQPMKDWRAAVRTWERNRAYNGKSRDKPNKFTQYAQHDSDFDIGDIALDLDEVAG